MVSDDFKLAIVLLSDGPVENLNDLMSSISCAKPTCYCEFFILNFRKNLKETDSFILLAAEFGKYMGRKCTYIQHDCNNAATAMNYAVDLVKKLEFNRISFLSDQCIVGPDWLTNIVDEAKNSNASIMFGPVMKLFSINYKSYLSETLSELQNTYEADEERLSSPFNAIFDLKFFDKFSFKFDQSAEFVGAEDGYLMLFRLQHEIVAEYVENAVVIKKISENEINAKSLMREFYRIGTYETQFLKKFDIACPRFVLKSIVIILRRILYFPVWFVQGKGKIFVWLSTIASALGSFSAWMCKK